MKLARNDPSAAATQVLFAALAGNIGVALVKLGAFAITRSTARLTEAIHSFVDTINQLLLLIGQNRAARAPDDTHPFGYGMEIYFWGFIVALMIFMVGGALSIWQGFARVLRPVPIERPWVNLIVLSAAAVFEGASFRVAYREFRNIVRGRRFDGRPVPLWRFLSISKDPGLYTTLLEDSAALAGLGLAAAGTVGAGWLGLAWSDGAASMAIGALLVAVALFMANETRSLIAGEAAAPPIVEAARAAIDGDPRVARIVDLASLQLGPRNILLAVTLTFRDGLSGGEVQQAVDDLVARARGADPRICDVFIRPCSAGAVVTATATPQRAAQRLQ